MRLSLRFASFAAAAVAIGACSRPLESPPDLQADYARAVPGFGGLFIDPNGVPTVYLTDLGQRERTRQALITEVRARGFQPEQLRIVQSQFDYLQLDRWVKRASESVFADPDVVFLDLDEARNRLVIGVTTTEGRARAASTLEGLGIPAAAVLVEVTAPEIPLVALDDRIRPVPAGVQVVGKGNCSLGFNTDHASSGNTTDHRRAFVTAGHCTEETRGVQGTLFRQGLLVVGTEISDPPALVGSACGFFAPVKCRYSDSARVLYSSDAPYNLAGIARTTHPGHLTGSLEINGMFRITAKQLHPLSGTRVHKIGARTGWTVGKITNTSYFSKPEGATILYVGQTRVDAGAQPGDSGSPVFEVNADGKTVTLYGIAVSGAVSGDEYGFSPMSGLEKDLGTLRVFTASPSGSRKRADLVPARLPGVSGPPGFCRRNAVGNLIVRVRNQSKHDLLVPTTTRVVFSPTEIASRSTPPLAAGASVDLPFQIPATCSADGSCGFTISVDASVEVDERHGDEIDEHEINNIETGECVFACPSGQHCCAPGPKNTCKQCLPAKLSCP